MSTYIYENQNSKSFYSMAWLGLGISFVGMLAGIWYLDADLSTKGFLAMAYFFTITSCMTVAKVVRDKHEAEKFINKVEQAKTEEFIARREGV